MLLLKSLQYFGFVLLMKSNPYETPEFLIISAQLKRTKNDFCNNSFFSLYVAIILAPILSSECIYIFCGNLNFNFERYIPYISAYILTYTWKSIVDKSSF